MTVKSGGLLQIHDVIPVTGYLSQSDPRPHFGLGKATKADVVEIRWHGRCNHDAEGRSSGPVPQGRPAEAVSRIRYRQ